MKWKAWKCGSELKFEEGVLYQKWYREQNTFASGGSPERTAKQYQWRPIPGQPGVTDILKG